MNCQCQLLPIDLLIYPVLPLQDAEKPTWRYWKDKKIFINRKKLLNYACRKTNNIFSFDNPKKYVSTLNILARLIQNLFCTTEIFLTRWPSEMVEKIVLNLMKFFRGGMQCISWDPFFYFRPKYMIFIPYFRPDWLKCHTCTFLCHTYLTV